MPENSKPISEVFTQLYDDGGWGGGLPETVSGRGSLMKATKSIRMELPSFCKRFPINTFLDAPCGDFNWMQHVNLPGVFYVGADIVPSLIRKNNEEYGGPSRVFILCDIVKDPLPAVDFISVRDLVQHLTLDAIFALINNALNSNVKYIGITSHKTDVPNTEVSDTGGYRPVDLFQAPFFLPEPLESLRDWEAGYTGERQLCIWSKQQLVDWAEKRDSIHSSPT